MILTSSVNCGNVQQKPDVVAVAKSEAFNEVKRTDVNGSATFDHDGNSYAINLYDGKTNNVVRDILVSLTIADGNGMYVIIDDKSNYNPRIADLGEKVDQKADSASEKYVSNVVLLEKGPPCDFMTEIFANTSANGAGNMENLFAQAKSGKGPFVDKFKKEKSNVKLKDLKLTIKNIMEAAVSKVASDTIENTIIKITLYLGTTVIKTAAETVFDPIMLLFDICDLMGKNNWADYYSGLCYEDTDEFDIWTFKGYPEFKFNLKTLNPAYDFEVSLLSNPIFIVLPSDTVKKHDWHAPIAKIKGDISGDTDAEVFFKKPTAKLEHVDGKLPTVFYLRPLFGHDGKYEFLASACESFNPTYKLSVSTMETGKDYGNPSTQLKVKDGDEYTVDFKLREECTDYKTITKGPNSFYVRCDIPENCTSATIWDIYEGNEWCDAIDIKARLGVGCDLQTVLDKQDNIYSLVRKGGIELLSDNTFYAKLFKHDNDSNITWKTEVNASSISIAGNGDIYADDRANLTSISADGKIKWTLDIGSKYILDPPHQKYQLTIVGNDQIYVFVDGALKKINSNGELEWEVYPKNNLHVNTNGLVPDNEGNLYLIYSRYDFERGILKFDSEGSQIFNLDLGSKILDWSEAIMDIALSTSSDSLYLPISGGVLSVSFDGKYEWKYLEESDRGSLILTSPSVDQSGNLFFIEYEIDQNFSYHRYLDSLTKQGKIRWQTEIAYKYDSYGPSQPTVMEDGSIYVSGYDGFYHIDTNGKILWSFKANICDTQNPPLVDSQGNVYLFSSNGTYKVATGSKLAKSPWPMYRANSQNTNSKN